jgi:hypothetical protein
MMIKIFDQGKNLVFAYAIKPLDFRPAFGC